MSPHFYINSLVLLPPWKWLVARKKSADPFLHTLFPPYVVQVHTMLYRFLFKWDFPNIWIGTTKIFLRKLFPQLLIAIFTRWALIQISDVSQERGSGCFILDQIQTCMFRLLHQKYPCLWRWVSTLRQQDSEYESPHTQSTALFT